MLLLVRRITDTETDTSNEAKALNVQWDSAFASALQDMDLDSTATFATLPLLYTYPNSVWTYAYQYPTDCAFFRRIASGITSDNRDSFVPKRIAIYMAQKVIYTNREQATGEYISTNTPLAALSPSAGLCIAARLAWQSSALVTGKGAKALMDGIWKQYIVLKAQAQEQDRNENFTYLEDDIQSEFVAARLS